MDFKSSELVTGVPRRQLKRPRPRPPSQIRRLNRFGKFNISIRINAGNDTEMEIRNWKLYMENKGIMEQNERLRQRALLLQRENQTLLSQLQNKLSSSSSSSSSPPSIGLGLQKQLNSTGA